MILGKSIISKFGKNAVIYGAFAMLLSCSSVSEMDAKRINDDIDPDLGMSREEFKDALTPKKTEREIRRDKELEPSIPDISEILTAPPAPESVPDKLISLSVTEEVPLKEVLIELARLADVDMEIDPGITGGIILRVKDRPFKDVIERVVDLGNLRYYMKNGVVRVERDRPYQVDYQVDFLNIVRDNESTTTVDTKGLGDSENTSPSGSTSTITSASEGDVWTSIQASIENMLMHSDSIQGTTDAPSNTEAVLQINKPAGIISIIATQKQHDNVDAYLRKVQRQLSAQVLIEAKVVEVTLDEAYRSGIDWGTLTDAAGGLGIKISGNFRGGVGSATDFFTISGDSGKNLSTAISLTEAFGVSRTLSSPRLHAMNNQQAVLTFAENSVYFEMEVVEQTEDDESGDPVTTAQVSSELKTVPVGVILSLQPSINLDTQEITMQVRPTISRITGTVNDPAVDVIIARTGEDLDVTSSIPVIEVRELDSILKIKSGEIMILGGLMKDSVTNDDKGVPFASRIPMLGNLFKSTVQITEVVETVIFIKATIVPTRGVSNGDKNLYKKFIRRDPHPLAF